MKKIMIPLVLLVVGIASNAQSAKKETPPPPKDEVVKSEPPKIKVTGPLDDDFYKRNPSVSNFSRQGNIISLKKKDGTTEKYDMSKFTVISLAKLLGDAINCIDKKGSMSMLFD